MATIYGVGGSIATAQVTVAATATLIAAARPDRQQITVVNGSTVKVYVGGSAVTTGTGVELYGAEGASLSLGYTGPIYGIVATGTEAVSVVEVYG
ncbi:MAG TPA: hypothetical protein VG248_02790 [Caulobacteraceae bacterium]|jgi:hypothetical protein|nr:hypothetical protein [Caulobacteraceae bacterium]